VSWEAAAIEASSARIPIAFAEFCRGDSSLTSSSAVRTFFFAVSVRPMETVRARAVIFSVGRGGRVPVPTQCRGGAIHGGRAAVRGLIALLGSVRLPSYSGRTRAVLVLLCEALTGPDGEPQLWR
jgi:hypothetical protein